MLEQLQKISTSAIDELIVVKEQREVLAARLERLAAQQGQVASVVLERVRGDYESQLGELELRAAPLKDEARHEYSKLEKLLESVQGELDSKQLDHEEIQLRHRLGEFDDEELERRGAEVETLLEKHRRDVDEISTVQERFVAAFDSEDDLRAAPAVEPPAAEPTPAEPSPSTPPPSTQPGEPLPPPPPPPLDPSPERDTAEIEEQEPAAPPEDAIFEPLPPPSEVEAPPAPDDEPSAVVEPPPVEDVREADGKLEEGEPTLSQPPPTEEEPSRPLTGATVLISTPGSRATAAEEASGATTKLPVARLVPEEPIFGISEFPVEPLTLIGRTPQNQVQVNDPAVSRSHAEIMLTGEGYLLRDLGSENGTYVNGDRIREKLLAEDDRLQIGTVRFVFSTSMPGGGPPPADDPR